MATNLSDANILLDFTVWLRDQGMIGESPSFQPPEIRIQTEEFRGGGMDMAVEIPMGIEKINFDFDVHVWNPLIFNELGYGPNSMNVPLMFRGYLQTPNGAEKSVIITTECLIKEIKSSKVQPGKKTELTVSCAAHYYQHTVENEVLNEISAFDKTFIVDGVDRSKRARQILGFGF
jgi:P2 family phage contractile tail tube protein